MLWKECQKMNDKLGQDEFEAHDTARVTLPRPTPPDVAEYK